MSEKGKKIKITTVAKAFLVIILFFLFLIGLALYFFPVSENKLLEKTAEIIPYPKASVGLDFITFSEAEKNLDSVRRFYESQDFSKLGLRVDFSTQDGKKRLEIKRKEILEKMITDLILKKEAEKLGIKITKDIVDQEVDRKIKEYGAEEYLKENLEKLYGWNLDDFKKNVVESDLYKEKLSQKIAENDTSYIKARQKIEEAQKELAEGIEFSEVAEKYSEGESSKKGGSLGWFSADQMLPEVAEEVFKLEKNKLSGIIKSSIGYHIIKVDDKKQEDNENRANVSQIFIRTKSFPEWLRESSKNHAVIVYVKNLKWNKEEGRIEFKDQGMKKYEENIMSNPINDPSLMF